MHEWIPNATSPEQKARQILSVLSWVHNSFKNFVPLWRGQAQYQFGVEPGMHTRVLNSSLPHEENTVRSATRRLITDARKMKLDQFHGNILPDLALLAHLQHHGAATPLLDVTTDPLVALWMTVFASPENPSEYDSEKGSLFLIKRPPEERWIDPLDSREYWSRPGSNDTSNPESSNIAGCLKGQYWWYRAPDVTERLRIQRGSFLIAELDKGCDRKDFTFRVNAAVNGVNSIRNRIEKIGRPSNGQIGKVEIFRIVVPAASKKFLRRILSDRSGLTPEVIYPTPWNRPFVTEFSQNYGRSRPLENDMRSPQSSSAP